MPSLNDYRLSELSVRVRAVLDCRDPVPLGLRFDDLVHDTDYEATQAFGAAAFADGLEGLLVHSATRLGDNLILFPDNLRVLAPGSRSSRAAIPGSTSSALRSASGVLLPRRSSQSRIQRFAMMLPHITSSMRGLLLWEISASVSTSKPSGSISLKASSSNAHGLVFSRG